MRILLVGEYSRLHNSLKAGLEEQGQEVHLAGTGDDFKKFPVDISFAPYLTRKNAFFKIVKRIVYKLTKLNLEETEAGIRFFFLLPKLKGYDVVQLINSNALETHPSWSRYLLKRLFDQNKKFFLLVCGDETPVVDYLLKKEMRNSVLTPYFEDEKLKNNFEYVLKYTTPPYRKLYEFVSRNVNGVIVSDLDYKIPLEKMGVQATLIPNPVIPQTKLVNLNFESDKTIIFLGINRLSRIKKGIPFFEKALEVIKKKYPEKTEIIIAESLPYAEYVTKQESAHILLDMVYAYDQGYNALEAMAKGKVVFTGAEQEFLDHYKLEEDEVCINALPDVDYLVDKLSQLIENPKEIERIGKNAREFIKQEHDYINIAKRYLDCLKKDG